MPPLYAPSGDPSKTSADPSAVSGADAKLQKAYGGAFDDAAAQLRDFCRAAAESWDRACAFSQIRFMGLGALRGYDEMIEETERHAADAEGADFAATAEKNAPPVQN